MSNNKCIRGSETKRSHFHAAFPWLVTFSLLGVVIYQLAN